MASLRKDQEVSYQNCANAAADGHNAKAAFFSGLVTSTGRYIAAIAERRLAAEAETTQDTTMVDPAARRSKRGNLTPVNP